MRPPDRLQLLWVMLSVFGFFAVLGGLVYVCAWLHRRWRQQKERQRLLDPTLALLPDHSILLGSMDEL